MRVRNMFKVSRNVILLGVVSFLNDMSSEMIAPILPIYLTDILKIEKIISGSVMGLVESITSLFKVVFGYVSDKFRNRKLFVSLGYTFSAVSKGALALTHFWWDFLALRVLDKVGKGVRTAPRDALIAESTEKKSSGRAFGFHRMMDTLGAVVGPLLAIGFLTFVDLPRELAFRSIFLLSAVPSFVGVLIVLLLVKDKGKRIFKSVEAISALRSRTLKTFLLIVAIGALGRYSYAFTMWRAGELGYTIIQSLFFYVIFNVIYSFSAYPIGIYSDKVGKRRVIAAGFGVAGFASLLFAYATDIITLILAFVLYGLYMAIEDTVPRAYMADIAEEHEKGVVIGAYHTVFGTFVFPASVIVGYLWQNFGLSYGFIYASLMSFVAMLLAAVVIRENQ